MIDWAMTYAAKGWPVFPLLPRLKRPLTSNGFKDATTDPATITRWWTRWPDANIGCRAGVAFSVLDVDGPVGQENLKPYLGDYHHAGPVAHTGKGWHWYFLPSAFSSIHGRDEDLDHDPPIQRHWIPKCDYQSADSYLVMPPSIHPNGQQYHWDRLRGPNLPLTAIPDWLADTLVPAQPQTVQAIRVRSDIYGNLTPVQSTYEASRPPILQTAIDAGLRVYHVGNSRTVMTTCFGHDDSTPSLALYLDQNTFFCHGPCQSGGDSHQLARKVFGYGPMKTQK